MIEAMPVFEWVGEVRPGSVGIEFLTRSGVDPSRHA